MKKIIVSDTSPLIALAKLDCLDLLFVSFSEVHLPQAVYREASHDRYRQDSQIIHDFVTQSQSAIVHKDQDNEIYKEFRHILDEGESQALALADEFACGILIDERLGRLVAKQHHISVVGVMGVLLQAKSKGKIKAIRPLIEKLLQSDYRLSDRVINIVLRKADEL